MTKKQIEQYKIRYTIENYICYKSKERCNHMAHRIANTKVNIKKYGKEIIDHNFNLVPVSCLMNNDSFNIGNNPGKCEKLIKLIELIGDQKLTAEEITKIIEA